MNEQSQALVKKAFEDLDGRAFGHPVSFTDKLIELTVRDVIKFIETEMNEDFANYPKWYKVIEKLETHFGYQHEN